MEKITGVIGCEKLGNHFAEIGCSLTGFSKRYIYYKNNSGWTCIEAEFAKDDFNIVPFEEYFEEYLITKRKETGVYSNGLLSDVKKESKLKEVLNIQVGGSHYKDTKIQPIEYIMANNLNFPEGCVVKYISRHRNKNKEQDLLKAMQNIQMILADEYGVVVEFKIKE